MSIEELFDLLPSKSGYEQDISLKEAELGGIHFCGDYERGSRIHKLLTKEGCMITYLEKDGILQYQKTSLLH